MTEQGTRSSRIRGAGKRRKRPSTRRRAVRIAAWSAAGVVLVGGGGLGYVYFKLNGNLKGVDINAQLGTERPQNVDNGSEDILVLGSDSRAGANKEYGDDGGGARSDTAMIIHVYQGHKTASVVSIPRDALVTRPACTTQDGKSDPGAKRQMFNTAYEVGGPACAVKTVEQMSGIRMDHYIEVDFTGFKKLIGQGVTEPVHRHRAALEVGGDRAGEDHPGDVGRRVIGTEAAGPGGGPGPLAAAGHVIVAIRVEVVGEHVEDRVRVGGGTLAEHDVHQVGGVGRGGGRGS